jgi:hypothetical protein
MVEIRDTIVVRVRPAQLIGKCHICKEMDKPIAWCGKCQHWFCAECRRKYWHRGIEAIKQLIGGKTPGCCGVTENEQTVVRA